MGIVSMTVPRLDARRRASGRLDADRVLLARRRDHRGLSRRAHRRRRVLLQAPAEPRRVLPRAPVDDVAAGRAVADGGARQRDRLPDAAVVDDQVRAASCSSAPRRGCSCTRGSRTSRCRSTGGSTTTRPTNTSRRGSTCGSAASRPASSSSGVWAGWRRRSTCRAWRSARQPAGGFRSRRRCSRSAASSRCIRRWAACRRSSGTT